MYIFQNISKCVLFAPFLVEGEQMGCGFSILCVLVWWYPRTLNPKPIIVPICRTLASGFQATKMAASMALSFSSMRLTNQCCVVI